MFARWMNVLVGLWVFVAPWVLGYRDPAASTNDFWVGLAVIAVAVLAMRVQEARLLNAGLGAWLIAAPMLLSYQTLRATVNDVLSGLFVLAFALVPTLVRTGIRRHGPLTP